LTETLDCFPQAAQNSRWRYAKELRLHTWCP